jgi:hypothetical protein
MNRYEILTNKNPYPYDIKGNVPDVKNKLVTLKKWGDFGDYQISLEKSPKRATCSRCHTYIEPKVDRYTFTKYPTYRSKKSFPLKYVYHITCLTNEEITKLKGINI